MRLADLLEAEDSRRLYVEPTGSRVRSDPLQRHVREWKARRPEDEAGEEGEMDAARHLEERIEVGDRLETAEPASKTGAAAAAKHGERIEHDGVANEVEHCVDL